MRYAESFYAAGATPVARTLNTADDAVERTRAVQRRIRVAIAEDHQHMREMLVHAIGQSDQFEIVGAVGDGVQAVSLVERANPDVLLIDLVMPVMNGIDAIRTLRERGCRVPALVLTSNADRDSVARAMEAGADGYVLKGASAGDIRSALKDVAVGGAVLAPSVARGMLDDYVKLLEQKRSRDLAVIQTLAGAVEKRDRVTGDHIHNVSALSSALYREMTGGDPPEELVYGFLLHDVGKIAIPDAVLQKPGPLTDEEFDLMRTHVEIGTQMIMPLGFSEVVTDVIRCHHERWDGRGYPNQLRGDQIPFHARLFSVVDAYDAMTADRPYRRGMTVSDALDQLTRGAGAQFDPACASAFVSLRTRDA